MSTAKPPSAFVFDFDGTLIDTEAVEYDSLAALWVRHGLTLPHEEWAAQIGNEVPDWIGLLCRQLANPIDASSAEQGLQRDQEMRTAAMPLRPGVMPIIHLANRLGIPTAIASNSPPDRLRHELARRHLSHRFDAVVTRDQVHRPKPAPDAYLLAAAMLGVAPTADAVAFEDSRSGVQAAVSAGLRCVAAPVPATTNHDFSEADLSLESLAELSLRDLARGILARAR